MEVWPLFQVASMPTLQILLISFLGAFLASEHIKVLPSDARRHMNKIVFFVFGPALTFSNLAKTVTLRDIISWWFMPVNIGITFLIGGVLGWIAVKILRPEHHLVGLVLANCSAGNLGNLLLIIIPVICNQEGNPFGDTEVCNSNGLSYASFSMAIGGIYIWTVAYSQMKRSAYLHNKIFGNSNLEKTSEECKDNEALVFPASEQLINDSSSRESICQEHQLKMVNSMLMQAMPLLSKKEVKCKSFLMWYKLKEVLQRIAEESLSPSTISAIFGLIVGSVPLLKSLLIGSAAPLKIMQDSMQLLGEGTVPCIILILGGNLTQGISNSRIRPGVIIAIICVRYVMLPLTGVAVVKAADKLGFIPRSPLYHFVLLIQYTLPPAMSIGTMAQLFNVGQEECSVIFFWTYLVAAFAFTVWSMAFIWILS